MIYGIHHGELYIPVACNSTMVWDFVFIHFNIIQLFENHNTKHMVTVS